jgi:DNA-directed RNA polymerase specialized sigma24 family protein
MTWRLTSFGLAQENRERRGVLIRLPLRFPPLCRFMAFPTTRHTLIQRLAVGGDAADWRAFHRDYWGAVCRFAQYAGHLSATDAEDVASQTFGAILQGRLLERWTESHTAKLRTLLCSVVRNILANQRRVEEGRINAVQQHPDELHRYRDSGPDRSGGSDEDLFYAAWADDIVHRAVNALLDEYNRTGRGDYFRVLYGRICEELPAAELANVLDLPTTSVDNYFRHARRRLSDLLHADVRDHVTRYVAPAEVNEESDREWHQLGEYLQLQGGLEAAIRRVELQQS